ncbi:MAG TPA: type II toxin-antitoxin system HicB family antitoxin [Gemmataceae bacterium]|nr:type II toxin-antitoxin system HicB family antitoxin [Gemmataceae bacterium]
MGLLVEVEQEVDGRWLAEVPELPGVLAYGTTRPEAIARAQALALRVIADRLDHGEAVPGLGQVFAVPT